ncbi:MAG: hypothetical protein ABSC08_01445, partial [Bryobacteraceae bacterium]
MPEPPIDRELPNQPAAPPPRRAWQRSVRAWFRARVRERVTLIGALYLFALLLTGLAAFASANNLLFLILAAMLATFMVSGL